MRVAYQGKDATRFFGCDWGKDPEARFAEALANLAPRYGPVKHIPHGSRFLTGELGRYQRNGDVRPAQGYIVVARTPDPPRALTAARAEEASSVRLAWQPPLGCREVAGYTVWRQSPEGPIQRLTIEQVRSCAYLDRAAPAHKATYLVRSVEYSGLYGAWSGPAWVEGREAGADVLDSYDLPGGNYMTPGEPIVADRRSVSVHVPAAGDYVLWGQGRAYQAPETIQVRVDGQPLPPARVEGTRWHWHPVGTCRLAAGTHVVELAREENLPVHHGNLLHNPGFENGLEGWVGDESVMSADSVRPRSGRQCLKLSGNLGDKTLVQRLALEVKPEWSYRMSFWLRGKFTKGVARYGGPNRLGAIYPHVYPLGRGPHFNILGPQFDDQWARFDFWFSTTRAESGEEPLVETSSFERSFRRGWEPGKPVRELLVQPFHCGAGHEGTLWLDDVEFVDLGPRLRPAKFTRLLITNVPGYRPQGPDGREAYRFPKVAPISVGGLRTTAQTARSLTMQWDAGRARARGYNVYLRAGPDCPATKYFQYTSVWGATNVTIVGLLPATAYSVKVTAINEDGLEGPPAAVQTRTAGR